MGNNMTSTNNAANVPDPVTSRLVPGFLAPPGHYEWSHGRLQGRLMGMLTTSSIDARCRLSESQKDGRCSYLIRHLDKYSLGTIY